MKRLILICGLLASSFSFGADWVFVTETSDADEDYYVDKSYYKYNSKTGVSEVWYKQSRFEGLQEYIASKTLKACNALIFGYLRIREKVNPPLASLGCHQACSYMLKIHLKGKIL